MERAPTKHQQILSLDTNYINFLKDIKEKLLKSQLRVARAVSQGTVQFYWELGKELIEKQKAFKWGEQFLTQFSHDLRMSSPGMQGFSVRNLQRMRQFATLYPNLEIAPQTVAQLMGVCIIL